MLASLNLNSIILVLILISHNGVFLAKARFLQATWLPVSYNTATIEDVNKTLLTLSQHGVQRVYVDVWNQGVVYFQSPTMEKFINNQTNPCLGRDILGWALEIAPLYQMEVIAWFEYGLMTSYALIETNAFATEVQSRGWMLGEHNNYYWMNASMIEVQDWFVSLLQDSVNHYSPLGLKGIQLDDHFGYPVSLGGSISVMNEFMNKIHHMVESYNSNQEESKILLSLAPSIQSMSLETYSVDWDLWGQQNLYDEDTIANISSSTKSLLIASGIRLDGSGSSTPQADVEQMIQYTKAQGKGNSIWYSRGIIETYPDIFTLIW